MGNFLTKAGGPLFDPLRDKTVNNKPGGALYDPLRDKTVNARPGAALYDPIRDGLMGGGGSGGGTDPRVMAMYAARAQLPPGAPGNQGMYQRDPQTGQLIPMPTAMPRSSAPGMNLPLPLNSLGQHGSYGMMANGQMGSAPPIQTGGGMPLPPQTGGGMPLPPPMDKNGAPMQPTQMRPSDQGQDMTGGAIDPAAQAAMAMLAAGGKGGAPGQPTRMAPRPYIVRQPGYYQQ